MCVVCGLFLRVVYVCAHGMCMGVVYVLCFCGGCLWIVYFMVCVCLLDEFLL